MTINHCDLWCSCKRRWSLMDGLATFQVFFSRNSVVDLQITDSTPRLSKGQVFGFCSSSDECYLKADTDCLSSGLFSFFFLQNRWQVGFKNGLIIRMWTSVWLLLWCGHY